VTYSLLGVFGILIIVVVAVMAPKLGVVAPLILVLVGIAASLIPGLPTFTLPPELILAAVLPPILYAAAVNIPIVDFRRNAKAITGLSVVLVFVSAFVMGAVFHWLLPQLSLPVAIALGAVVSPPDAVATAVIIGFLVGHATVWLRSRLDSVVLNTTISFAVPFLAFVPANEIKASGVLAVVVAGLVTGHQSARLFSAQARISERINWRTAQFILENGVFLVMGFELKSLVDQVKDSHFSVAQSVGLGFLATVILTIVRIAFVIPLIALLRRDESRAAERAPHRRFALWRGRLRVPANERVRRRERLRATRRRADLAFRTAEGLDWRGGAVIAWSGMRGVVTVAAAHSLPATTPYRPQLLLIAFTVAIVTLLVQGGTLPFVIRTLGIAGNDAAADRAELASLVEEINTSGLLMLENPAVAQENGDRFDPPVVERVRSESIMRTESLSESPGATRCA
jgi:NhaP-type Na+/H+ or K+/H+ antiporter